MVWLDGQGIGKKLVFWLENCWGRDQTPQDLSYLSTNCEDIHIRYQLSLKSNFSREEY